RLNGLHFRRMREEILTVGWVPLDQRDLAVPVPLVDRRTIAPGQEKGAVTGGRTPRAHRLGKLPPSRQGLAPTSQAVTGGFDRSKPVTAPGTDSAGGINRGWFIPPATTPASRPPPQAHAAILPGGHLKN